MRAICLFLSAAVLLAGSDISAETPEKTEESKPKDKRETEGAKTKRAQEEVPTFTTHDLERKYGPSPKTVPKAGTKAAADKRLALSPLEALEASRNASRERAALHAKAAQRVQQLQTKLAELEQRLARLRNPLLGRAQPGQEDAKAWKAADQVQRLRLTEQSLATTRQELAQAQKELNAPRRPTPLDSAREHP